MQELKTAYFPFNVILYFFKKWRCKTEKCTVAMIDPFRLKILVQKGVTKLNTRHYKHEFRHIEQVKEEGRLKFVVKYLFYNIKYGYQNNPYEVDARNHEA